MMEARVAQLEGDLSTLKLVVEAQLKDIDKHGVDLIEQLNSELTKHNLMMQEVVEGAKGEFHGIQGSMKGMCDEVSGGIKELVHRISELEKGCSAGPGQKGYIPLKAMVPKEFTGKSDDWRSWQDDLLDYFDNVTPGMREFLKEVDLENDAVTEECVAIREAKCGPRITGDTVQVWRALKALTGGEAKKVTLSVKTEDGFRAWQRLHMHFGPSLAYGRKTGPHAGRHQIARDGARAPGQGG